MYSWPLDYLKKISCFVIIYCAYSRLFGSFFKKLETRVLNSWDHFVSYLFTSGAGSFIIDFTSFTLWSVSLGALPEIISKIVIPKDHMSQLFEYGSFYVITSGAIQAGLPINSFSVLLLELWKKLPKNSCPFSWTNIFSDLISLCIKPLWWK